MSPDFYLRATSLGAAGGGDDKVDIRVEELKVLPMVSIEAMAFDLVTWSLVWLIPLEDINFLSCSPIF